MRVLALYLPQFHRTKENDEWWGTGYTEWTAVKNAKPLFEGHDQPRVPLDNNYYDLADETGAVWSWQANLAKENGIFGFCIYHYWLGNGKQLLQKPMEILLKHPEIDINYCICWANHDWTRAWYGQPDDVLCKQEYGIESEWKTHFEYLKDFFSDPRYIKIDNKPMVCIYDTKKLDCLANMRRKWDEWAKELGFDGIYIVSANTAGGIDELNYDFLDGYYNFEAGYTYYTRMPFINLWLDFQLRKARMMWAMICGKKTCGYRVNARGVYKMMTKNPLFYRDKKIYQGIFSGWDNTPRRGVNGMVYVGASPQLFEKTLNIINNRVEEDDFVFVDAWNEWGEGCYLEPDVKNGYGYLNAIKNVIEDVRS